RRFLMLGLRYAMAISLLLAGALAAPVPAHAQGITDMKKGDGTNAVQGSAGPSGTPNAASDLERCDKPMGAVAGGGAARLRGPGPGEVPARVAGGPHPPHGPAVELLHRGGARDGHEEHDAGARPRQVRRAPPGLEHGRRPDGLRRLRPHPEHSLLGE